MCVCVQNELPMRYRHKEQNYQVPPVNKAPGINPYLILSTVFHQAAHDIESIILLLL